MRLSVIIPTKNRSFLLRNILRSILNQTLSPDHFEVLVVDNGSTDNTAEVAEDFKKDMANLRYFHEKQPGLHAGRHLGLLKSTSDILVYADDDIEAFDTWLEGIWESFQDEIVMQVGGKCLPKFETAPPRWLMNLWENPRQEDRYIGYLSILDLGDRIRVNPPRLVGCNYAIRKDLVMEFGGFHPDSMPASMLKYRGDGESWVTRSLKQRGLKMIYNPKASVFHYVSKERMTIDYFYKRAFAQGISNSYAKIRYRDKGHSPGSRLKHLRYRLKRMIKTSLMIDREGTKLARIMRKGIRDGFKFHQEEIKKDPRLLKWILKKNYF